MREISVMGPPFLGGGEGGRGKKAPPPFSSPTKRPIFRWAPTAEIVFGRARPRCQPQNEGLGRQVRRGFTGRRSKPRRPCPAGLFCRSGLKNRSSQRQRARPTKQKPFRVGRRLDPCCSIPEGPPRGRMALETGPVAAVAGPGPCGRRPSPAGPAPAAGPAKLALQLIDWPAWGARFRGPRPWSVETASAFVWRSLKALSAKPEGPESPRPPPPNSAAVRTGL